VTELVEGMPVQEALTTLKLLPQAAAKDVARVVRSAAANAEHNFNLNQDELFLKILRVEAGPILKRGRPRAQGRYFSIFKRTSHITAVVEDRPGLMPARPAPRPAPAEAAQTPAPPEPTTARKRAGVRRRGDRSATPARTQ
jgi:large subunit ribosomal protein L22